MKKYILPVSLFTVSVLLLVSLAFNVSLLWQIHGVAGWRDEVYALAVGNANFQAMSDYENGELRLYEFDETEGDREFTGEMEGVFEIWRPLFYPGLGEVHRHSTESYTTYYNRKMRHMLSHPEDFPLPEGITPSPEETANAQETGSGDFAAFFQEKVAEMGIPKKTTRSFDFPEVTWKFELDSDGFIVETFGWNYEQMASFFGELFGTTPDMDSPGMVSTDEVFIQFIDAEDGSIMILGSKQE